MNGASTIAAMAGTFHRPERLAVVVDEAAPDTGNPRVYLSTMPNSIVVILDPPAADIWRAAVELHDPDAVLAAVAETFDVDADVIHDDVVGFLTELHRNGLLEWREAPEPG